MTVEIEVQQLYKLVETLEKDADGYVQFAKLLTEASAFYGCTQLTVRNFINKHSQYFEMKYGLVKVKLIATLKEQEEDSKVFLAFLENRNAVLDECVNFLSVQNQSPYVQNMLALANSARHEFGSYTDSNLRTLLEDLEREFHFVPQKEINHL
jgi:hypothetical protein